MFTNLTQSQISIFILMLKRTITLHLNIGTSEFLLFVLFFFTCCFAFPGPIFRLLLRDQAQTLKVNYCVFLLLFQLESQKELHYEVDSWWSTQRVLKWQHFNSYLMPSFTDLFCHSFLNFPNSNMLTDFNPLPRKYRGSTYP